MGFILIKKNDDEAAVSGQTRTFLSKDADENSSVSELMRKDDQHKGTETTTTKITIQKSTPSTATYTPDASKSKERPEEPRRTEEQKKADIEKHWNVTNASEK